jgi:hypothetical protein
MPKRRRLTSTAVLLLALGQSHGWAQSNISLSLVLDGPSTVGVDVPVELHVLASFDHRLSAIAFRLHASGPAGAYLTARSANPAEANGLSYISALSQDPFDPQLPQDLTIDPVIEVLTDLDYTGDPGGIDDGLLPGSDFIIERLEVTPAQPGPLTIILSDVQALTTQANPDGDFFDTVTIAQGQVTITVTSSPALAANAGNDQVIGVHNPTTTVAGSATGGTPPYTYLWAVSQQPAGSGPVSFADPGAASTAVTLSKPMLEGIYELNMAVTDSQQVGSDDTVRLIVHTDHPADSNEDWSASISEVTAYAACWRSGCVWPMPPSVVQIEAVTRIGFLWRQGESYHYDPLSSYPVCWQPGSAVAPAGTAETGRPATRVNPASRSLAAANDGPAATRSITSDPGGPGRYRVTISITLPPAGAVWAVEDLVPNGWVVQDVNEQGGFESVGGKVKWGPFFDNQARELEYAVTRPENAPDTTSFAGVLSVDGQNVAILGDSSIDAPGNDHSARPAAGSPCGPGIPEALLCTSFILLLDLLRKRSKT